MMPIYLSKNPSSPVDMEHTNQNLTAIRDNLHVIPIDRGCRHALSAPNGKSRGVVESALALCFRTGRPRIAGYLRRGISKTATLKWWKQDHQIGQVKDATTGQPDKRAWATREHAGEIQCIPPHTGITTQQPSFLSVGLCRSVII